MRFAVIVVVCALFPSRAGADDPKAEAAAHLSRATDLHKEGKREEALQELLLAYVLDPQPKLLYGVAQLHAQLGQCDKAIVFYKRFLETKPPADAVQVVNEAMATCKDGPPTAEPPPPPPPEPTPPAPVAVAPPPPPTPEPSDVDRSDAWYADKVGVALVGGGVVAGILCGVMIRVGQSDLDAADAATSYADFDSNLDGARRARMIAVGLGIGSAALLTAGVYRYATRQRAGDHGVAMIPAGRGGLVVWSGRF